MSDATLNNVTYVECDFLTQSWLDRLVECGLRKTRPTLVVWEGVTMYLTREVVMATLDTVAQRFDAPAAIAFEYYSPETVAETAVRMAATYREPLEFCERPDGIAAQSNESDPPEGPENWTLRRAIRDRRVLLLALTIGLQFMAMTAILQVLHSHLTDGGMSGAGAAQIIAIMTLGSAIAKPLFGSLADWINPRAVMGISIALQASGVTLILSSAEMPHLFGAAAIFGLGYGGVLPVWGVLLGALFGRKHFGAVMGLMAPIMLPFQMLALPFATGAFDRYGTYSPAFVACLGGYAVSALALMILPIPARRGPADLVTSD